MNSVFHTGHDSIRRTFFWGALLSVGLSACVSAPDQERDLYYVPALQKYVSSIPEYSFKDSNDVAETSRRIDGRVMVFFHLTEEAAVLVPRGLFCAQGTPPFVTVDYVASNREQERELLDAIVRYNRSLLSSGRISATYQCRLDSEREES
jgi:hypothetical protein